MKGSVDDHCGPVEAAPSTDEGEARWERMEESPDYVVWRKRWAEGYSESSAIPKAVEAAIRAPLEEQIRELEARVHVREVENAGWRAENARLREALERSVRNYHAVWCASLPGPMALDWRECVSPECAIVRALATPPSSTEDTKLCPVCGVQNDHTVIGHEDYPDHVWAGAKEGGE